MLPGFRYSQTAKAIHGTTKTTKAASPTAFLRAVTRSGENAAPAARDPGLPRLWPRAPSGRLLGRCAARREDEVAQSHSHRSEAFEPVHQGDLAALLVSDSLGHDPQAEVGRLAHRLVGHGDRAGMVEGHERHEPSVEGRAVQAAERLDLAGI